MEKNSKYLECPESVRGGLKRYIENKIEPGSFLFAVLSNDLFGAMGKADLGNRMNLFNIVNWIYNNAPCSCHGSKDIVVNWLNE